MADRHWQASPSGQPVYYYQNNPEQHHGQNFNPHPALLQNGGYYNVPPMMYMNSAPAQQFWQGPRMYYGCPPPNCGPSVGPSVPPPGFNNNVQQNAGRSMVHDHESMLANRGHGYQRGSKPKTYVNQPSRQVGRSGMDARAVLEAWPEKSGRGQEEAGPSSRGRGYRQIGLSSSARGRGVGDARFFPRGRGRGLGKNWRRGHNGDVETAGSGRLLHGKRGGATVIDRKRLALGAEYGNEENQRVLLIEQLWNGTYECTVCCEEIVAQSNVWSCRHCYHIFHLRCIKMWARSPAAADDGDGHGWRCPTCQHVCQALPAQYRCFCGKVFNPDWNHQDTPHSCGELCRRNRGDHCTHPCNILCHPGPCPSCETSVTKSCNCQKTKQNVRCSQTKDVKCNKICEKTLNCGRHCCQLTCHEGACEPCQVMCQQKCFCEKTDREVVCGSSGSFDMSYSCQQKCDSCADTCHAGQCADCPLQPPLDISLDRCHCGQSRLTDLDVAPRRLCTDPIPACQLVCGKRLTCGPPDDRHRCQQTCHSGDCGPCPGVTSMTCHCSASYTTELPCTEVVLFTDSNPFKCDKRCSKKLQCQRHRCKELCCVDDDHTCMIVCGKMLTCGLHRCDELCHRNNCATCWHVSFDELLCHCGSEVIYPPIPCGILPPECHKLCTRPQACDHPVSHSCHSEETCPPCTQLTKKWCLGEHEERDNIPCHQNSISCGMPCRRDLPCGQHKCQQKCHKGTCLSDGERCTQECQHERADCGHPCAQPCHPGQPCRSSICKALVTLKCVCGHRKAMERCSQSLVTSSKRMVASMLAMKLKDAGQGQGIDLAEIADLQNQKTNKKKQLDCNEECGRIERNKRVALALQIHNPDVSNRLVQPPYPQTIKNFARLNLNFVLEIEKALTDLVQMAQQSKQAKRSHAFAPMSFEKRHLVHNLAEFYGCETQSYDDEPNKNVVATAHKNKCWQPTVLLSSIVSKAGKVPTPIPHGNSTQKVLKNFTYISGRRGDVTSTQTSAPTTAPPSAPKVNSWAACLK